MATNDGDANRPAGWDPVEQESNAETIYQDLTEILVEGEGGAKPSAWALRSLRERVQDLGEAGLGQEGYWGLRFRLGTMVGEYEPDSQTGVLMKITPAGRAKGRDHSIAPLVRENPDGA